MMSQDPRRVAREYIKGVVTVTITGERATGKTVLAHLIRDFLRVECKFEDAEVIIRLHQHPSQGLRAKLDQARYERDAKVILVDLQ